ncbi:MAG TPA: M42 family metallopeptidase [Candidatus Choladousia intestinigallinarum]|nr:M42 family metallopeptidase [Candidatus Choladousia intestinigallinarum]
MESLKNVKWDDYTEYAVEQARRLLEIDSPSGYGEKVTNYLLKEFGRLGIKAERTNKGGVFADFGGENCEDALLLEAHCDTLGAMVHQIKENGRLKLTPVGGMRPENAEAENCRILTKAGQIYEGTCQLLNASVHVNGDYTVKRDWDTLEVVIDENVNSKEDVKALGIMNGDYVCFEPRTRVTGSGYIKSRFLDDKLSAGILMAVGKYLKENRVVPARRVYAHFTIFEEVGHGGASPCPAGVTEAWSVDMGCVGEGMECTERQVSICAKDSGGPYSYEVVRRMIQVAQENSIDFAVDIYPYYGSDVEATLNAGNDIRHGLIGPGVYASHGYERSHKDGVRNTFKLICCYLEEAGDTNEEDK